MFTNFRTVALINCGLNNYLPVFGDTLVVTLHLWVAGLWHYCFYYIFGFPYSFNEGKQQSYGAGAVVGIAGSGHSVPALVVWMATRWKEKRGRARSNHQGEWLLYEELEFQEMW